MGRKQALLHFIAAIFAIATGVLMAAVNFPGGFDWVYTVISKLASRTHNPDGGAWLAGGLLVAMLLLWPVAGHLGGTHAGRQARAAVAALRVGLLGGALLALEGLFTLDFSGMLRKGHEVLALVTFLALYGSVLGLCIHRIRHDVQSRWPTLLLLVPIVAVGASQLALYLDQRQLGWVNTGWRELGVPVWLSFAFWQWLAAALLWVGLGYVLVRHKPRLTTAEAPRQS